MTEKILEPRGIRDEIIDILKTVDKYGYCLDSDIEWQADRIMEAYAAQQSKMPTEDDIGEEVLSKHYETPEENMAFLDGATFVVEWLRNQIEKR